MDENVSYLDLPNSFKVKSEDVDFGCGNWRRRKKLERDKKKTAEGQTVQSIENNLSKFSIHHAVSIEEIQEVLSQQYAAYDILRTFYYSSKRIKEERTKQIQQKRFKLRLCTSERQFIVDQNDQQSKTKPVMLIGDKGTGVGSRIKGFLRYGGKGK
ncbi:hypothetical protein BCV72DRAFT_229513 [Rhizopus microsporus var. microsporus]|uniref:Uncharacterized protein n=2 Tax=Rhizopus microsporus TaxID=58291 RepID=A0A2G4SWT0_RHIZD|nr:uncharacterized protein RHIMIDRAFT_281623 [Rhizopus microsporus ATCC 52813]ORE05628.1 hypothetical protein BCV72DRAFT_229513 [Rhizopus microsporus var. microsporus]PHZ13204.1 hypothetical protein RHIMIDRAFT_281623 [Rhizopus microsporus ATCC 52813]